MEELALLSGEEQYAAFGEICLGPVCAHEARF